MIQLSVVHFILLSILVYWDFLYRMVVLWCCLISVLICYVQCTVQDGGKAPRIRLNDGNSMPQIGLGTFLGFDEKGQKVVKDGEVEQVIRWSLAAGYRMIDTASGYANEEQIGRGVKQSAVPRQDVFLVTKLGTSEKRDVVKALRDSLRRLDMDYVDLYLIHNPLSFKDDHKTYDVIDYVDSWKGMEEAKRLGLAKSIGVSNFNVSQMERLLYNSEIKPAVLQVEVNLNLAQTKLIDFCKVEDIAVMAYTPFGSLFSSEAGDSAPPPPRASHPTLVQMADKYKKSVPQIVLRYLVQRGVAPIPKSVRKDKIEQNIDIFDFKLTDDEMDTLNKFNKDFRTVSMSFWQDHPYYPFEQKDVIEKNPFDGI